jgi:hypothetical protein
MAAAGWKVFCSAEALTHSPTTQSDHPARREREVGVGVVQSLAQKAMTAVEHGGDEETIADRANLACGNVLEREGGEVAPGPCPLPWPRINSLITLGE